MAQSGRRTDLQFLNSEELSGVLPVVIFRRVFFRAVISKIANTTILAGDATDAT